MYPPKPAPRDAVAVLSPSGRSPARFPAPFELGLRRLREEFELRPVEYPTTRVAEASPLERAEDVHAAFADPDVKAVIASIGGADELKVLAYLDPDVLVANPKPFFGYSDNTNLHLFLWRLGIVSYHGGSLMVELGRPVSMHPTTRESLERALFTRGKYVLEPPGEYSDEEREWTDQSALSLEQRMFAAEAWSWYGPKTTVAGIGWGGSLEIVDFHLRTNRYLLADDAYDGCILFLETPEEMWPATYVSRVLMSMGERGLLQRFSAVLWARPKACLSSNPVRLARRRATPRRSAMLSSPPSPSTTQTCRSSSGSTSATLSRSTSFRAAARSSSIPSESDSRSSTDAIPSAARPVDLRALPGRLAAPADPGSDEYAGSERALVEELHSPRPEPVEAVRAEVDVAERREALRVYGLCACGCRGVDLAGAAEELNPAVAPAPGLPRLIDGDRCRRAEAQVARMSRRRLRQPHELEIRAPREVGGVDVRSAARPDGRDRTERRRVEQLSREARDAGGADPAVRSLDRHRLLPSARNLLRGQVAMLLGEPNEHTPGERVGADHGTLPQQPLPGSDATPG